MKKQDSESFLSSIFSPVPSRFEIADVDFTLQLFFKEFRYDLSNSLLLFTNTVLIDTLLLKINIDI